MPRELKSVSVGSVNLRKRGGRWQARWQANGNRYSRSLEVTNLRIAEKKARALSDLVEAGDFESARSMFIRVDVTFSEVCEEFVRHMADSGQWAPSTVDGYKTPKHNLLREFGVCPISAITPKEIEGLLAKIMERDGLSRATRNRYLAFLKSMFKVAVRWGYVARSPAAEVKLVKETPVSTKHLMANQLSALMSILKARGGLAYDVAVMLSETGLRIQNVREMRWEQVDFEQRTITIPKTKSLDQLEVPMSDLLFENLTTMYKGSVSRTLTKVIPINRRRHWVFPSPTDPSKHFHNIRKGLISAAKEAGLGHVHHHMFRTTLITDMVNANVNPLVTQQVVGHRNLATTQKYYRHSLNESRKALDKVHAHRSSPR